MKTLHAALLVTLSMLSAGSAWAQSVWRCGPDGREYRAQPCHGGRVVDVDDARSADQVQAARAIAAREHRLANDMAEHRRRFESSANGVGPAGIAPEPVAFESPIKPKRSKKKKKKATGLAAAPASRATAPGSR
jgi:hypothetical protein